MKFKSYFLITLLFFCVHAFSQEKDLDEIFDDGDKDSRFFLGTDVMVLGTGTFNLNLEVKITDGFYIRPGIGFLPLGRLLDFSYWRPSDQGVPIVDRKVSNGFYYDGLIRFDFSQTRLLYSLDGYFYAKYKHWQYDYKNDFKVERFKVSAGFGKSIGLKGRFHLDYFYGVVFSRDKLTYLLHDELGDFDKVKARNYGFDRYKKPSLTKEFLFFEFGIGLKYGL